MGIPEILGGKEVDREEAQALQDNITEMMEKVNSVNSAIAISDLPHDQIDGFDTARDQLEEIAERIALILENY